MTHWIEQRMIDQAKADNQAYEAALRVDDGRGKALVEKILASKEPVVYISARDIHAIRSFGGISWMDCQRGAALSGNRFAIARIGETLVANEKCHD